jgi:Secretion system C-terminal sorting domain
MFRFAPFSIVQVQPTDTRNFLSEPGSCSIEILRLFINSGFLIIFKNRFSKNEDMIASFCNLFRIFLFWSILSTSVFSQGNVFNIWHFGWWGGIDFNGGAPVALGNGQTITTEGTATICDATGALLFYTDGVTVWDRSHTQMPNGFGLSGDVSTTQSALIVQRPGSTSLYYVFTVPADGAATDFRYSVVNMTLNGGFGDIPAGSKNILLAAGNTVAEKITAVRHCNGTDWWIITHGLGNNSYRSWLLSATGVGGAPVVSSAGTVITTAFNRGLGWLTASHNGQKLAMPSYSGGTLDIVDFNNSTAAVSNPKVLTGLISPYGTEWSPNDQLLYTTSMTEVYQYNATLATGALIQASQFTVASGGDDMRAIRMGPDGKIYVCAAWSPWLGVINNPNVSGAGCGYTPFGIDLSAGGTFIGQNSLGLSNHYNFFNPCGPLDAGDVRLEVDAGDEEVYLNWKNTAGLAEAVRIERSIPDSGWQTIGEWQGAPQATSGNWVDNKPIAGTAIYRLLARDTDGNYTNSNVAEVRFQYDGFTFTAIYPNPAKEVCILDMYLIAAELISVTVTDLSGRILFVKNHSCDVGVNHISISTASLAAGTYLLRVRSGGCEISKRLVKE